MDTPVRDPSEQAGDSLGEVLSIFKKPAVLDDPSEVDFSKNLNRLRDCCDLDDVVASNFDDSWKPKAGEPKHAPVDSHHNVSVDSRHSIDAITGLEFEAPLVFAEDVLSRDSCQDIDWLVEKGDIQAGFSDLLLSEENQTDFLHLGLDLLYSGSSNTEAANIDPLSSNSNLRISEDSIHVEFLWNSTQEFY